MQIKKGWGHFSDDPGAAAAAAAAGTHHDDDEHANDHHHHQRSYWTHYVYPWEFERSERALAFTAAIFYQMYTIGHGCRCRAHTTTHRLVMVLDPNLNATKPL